MLLLYLYFSLASDWAYTVSIVKKTWLNARNDCLNKNGSLLNIKNEFEEAKLKLFLLSPTLKASRLWIGGLTNKSDNFIMGNGSSLINGDLAKGQPIDNPRSCKEIIRGKNWESNNTNCKNKYYYICKVAESTESKLKLNNF